MKSWTKRRSSFLRSVEYIHNHFYEDISISLLADMAGMDKETYIRVFTKSMKETPVQYINDFRIDRAKYLLEFTEMPIDLIADEVGYKLPDYFKKLFQKLTGLKPEIFRKQAFDLNNLIFI